MKTKITLLLMACFAVAACSKLHYGHGNDDDGGQNGGDDPIFNEINIDEGAGSASEGIRIIPNEIVVRYSDTNSAERDVLRQQIQLEYPSLQIEECTCGDMDLWIFDPATDELEIEGVVNGLPSRNPAGKVRGDQAFDIVLPTIEPFTPQGQGGEPAFIAAADPSSVNIAIIDTGIDFFREEINSDTNRILFPSSNYSDCLSTQSGWNYLGDNDADGINEGNQDILDQNGHGTYVTKIILDEVESSGYTAQILPLKVFDAEGRGSYWDVLCALAYVKNINENGGNISIVNASFGGSMPQAIFEVDAQGNPSLFAEMLEELNNLNTLVVTSAGNKGQDNELGPDRDFLSFFDADNILSVGGYFDDEIRPVINPVQLATDSNYGATSIDIALAFNNYQLIFDNLATAPQQDRVTLAGTSYSAAAMSALAAKTVAEAQDMGRILTPSQLKQTIFENSSVTTGEFQDRIIDNKVILRE